MGSLIGVCWGRMEYTGLYGVCWGRRECMGSLIGVFSVEGNVLSLMGCVG